MAGGGQSTRLPHVVPEGWAMELVLTGDDIDAETAQRIGVVNRIVPQHELLLPEATALAQRMIECGPTVVRETKAFMRAAIGQPLHEALALEDLYYARIQESHDYDVGTQAFVEANDLSRVRPEFTRS
jgi:enoyl-CoA hydratase/carnithine racemase